MKKTKMFHANIYGIVDTKTGEIIYEGYGRQCAEYMDISHHTVFKYVKEKRLLKERYKFIVLKHDVLLQREIDDISDELRDTIVQAYKNGASITKIQMTYHIGKLKIDKILEEEGLKVTKPLYQDKPPKKLDKGKVGALRRAGWSFEKIADEMFTSVGNVKLVYEELMKKDGKE